MTNEQAIDRLRKISEKTPIRTNGDDLVAITMAIKAMLENEELSKDLDEALKEIDGYERGLSQEPTEKPMCDRNICISNEYNGIGCDECIVNKAEQEPYICDTCKHKGAGWDTEPCDGCCGNHSGYEPCDDAISRQAAIVALDDRMSSFDNVDMQIAMGFAKGIIHDLPPVTQKLGKWLMTGEVDVYYNLPSYECSKCGKTSLENGDYCPNCGAEMVGEKK